MILDELAQAARVRVEEYKKQIPLERIKALALENKLEGFPFEKALTKPDLTFICELKKASPSKGIIAREFRPLELLEEYEEAGADALSVLSEPQWFLGSDEILKQVCDHTSLPVLRKDFVVDEYMIYQARVLGASAVLLIVSILDEENLKQYINIAEELGLSALVEAHDELEIEKALQAGARIIGVNNRNLKDFSMDMQNSRRLSSVIPDHVLFVSESGMQNHEDVQNAIRSKADAVLIGESLMRADNKKDKLNEFRHGKN